MRFTAASQETLQAVAAAVVDGQDVAAGRVLERDDDAVTCALIAGVGQDRYRCGVGVQR